MLAENRWQLLALALLIERVVTAGRSRAAARRRSTGRADAPVRAASAVERARSDRVSGGPSPELGESAEPDTPSVREPEGRPSLASPGAGPGGRKRAETARRRAIARAGLAAAGVAVVTVIAIVATSLGGSSSAQVDPLASFGHLKSPPPGRLGPEGIPVPNALPLARAASASDGTTVDGIPGCLPRAPQIAYQYSVHLSVFVEGAARQIPYGIGMTNGRADRTPRGTFVDPGNCFSILHTDAADGMIHVVSTKVRIFTLGNFFDVWGQPLGRNRVGPATGPVTVFVNGRPYTGNPRAIPLRKYAVIQLEVGRPLVAPAPLTKGGTATDL